MKIVRTLGQLAELQEYLQDKDLVAFDTETVGTDKDSEIIGYSVCAEVDLGWYVIVSYWDVPTQKLVYLETKEKTRSFLQYLRSKRLIMQNACFDCDKVEQNYQVSLMDSVEIDTMILAHVVDENRSNGLKELGRVLFGEDSVKEQLEMKESVHKNGGVLTKEKYELYKGDSELIAKYGAKDAILTLKVFYEEMPKLYEQGLDKFFFEESMPLLKGGTYQLNTTGLRVDPDKLQKLKQTLEADCLDAKGFIHKEIESHVKLKYPGTGKTNHFNIGSSKQLSWLLFDQLGNEFNNLTKEGREVCKSLGLKLPYTFSAKKEFLALCTVSKGTVYQESKWNPKTRKVGRPKKIGDAWNYLACGKETLSKLAPKYKWVARYLEYAKNLKLLNTYVTGIQSRMKYNVIRPSFLQNVVPSGRYASRNPNFQNLPRDDKRIKECIISRPGKVFVGCDYPQLEPRVFASFSKDWRLLECFKRDEDFYSVIGMHAFDKTDCVPLKEGPPNAFGTKYKNLRQISKVIALSATYGTTAPKMAPAINKSIGEAQEIIDNYFETFPSVKAFMEDSHQEAIKTGKVTSLFGRPRRIPGAMSIPKLFPGIPHDKLPYEQRNLLNLAVNYRIQGTGGSIMNRAAIRFLELCKQLEADDISWQEVKLVLQIHDELVAEGPEHLAESIVLVLKEAMENTVKLPGVDLPCEPKIAYNLADLK